MSDIVKVTTEVHAVPSDMGVVIAIAQGTEISRRAAWAAYFTKKQEITRLLKLNMELQVRMAEFALAISEDECLQVLDPEGELIHKAKEMIATMRLRARGAAAIERAKQNRAKS